MTSINLWNRMTEESGVQDVPEVDDRLRDMISRLRAERYTLRQILTGAGLPMKIQPDLSNFLNGKKPLSDAQKNPLLTYVQEELKKFPHARHAHFQSAMDFYDVHLKKIEKIAPQIVGTYNAYSRPTSYGTSRSTIIMRSSIEILLTDDNLITATEIQQEKRNGQITAIQHWNGYVVPRLSSLVVALREQVSSWPRFIFLHNFGRMNQNKITKLLGFSSTITTAEPFFSRVILDRSTNKVLEPDMVEEHSVTKEIREALLIDETDV